MDVQKGLLQGSHDGSVKFWSGGKLGMTSNLSTLLVHAMTAWSLFLASDIDRDLHIIRGGLNYNMKPSWDGVRGLADAMSMLKRRDAPRPPAPGRY